MISYKAVIDFSVRSVEPRKVQHRMKLKHHLSVDQKIISASTIARLRVLIHKVVPI